MLAGKRVPLNNETSLLAAAVYFTRVCGKRNTRTALFWYLEQAETRFSNRSKSSTLGKFSLRPFAFAGLFRTARAPAGRARARAVYVERRIFTRPPAEKFPKRLRKKTPISLSLSLSKPRRALAAAQVLFYYRRMPQPANRKLLAEEQGMLFSARPPSNKNVNAHQGAEDAIRRLSELRFEASEL